MILDSNILLSNTLYPKVTLCKLQKWTLLEFNEQEYYTDINFLFFDICPNEKDWLRLCS